MTQTAEAIKRISEALEAGPTKGPWLTHDRPYGPFWHIYSEHTIGGERCKSGRQAIGSMCAENKKGASAYYAMFKANADFVVAANPEAIAAILASHAALLDLIDAALVDLDLNWDKDAKRTAKMIRRRLADITTATGAAA